MKIQDQIKIDNVYTRSINLERDIDSLAIIKAYIPTSRSLLTLRRIGETLTDENMPRSWALIGPYGSGKSSFAVYLAHLLGNPSHQTTEAAIEICRSIDTKISADIFQHIADSEGYLSVLLTGSPEPLGKRFVASLRDAAIRFWQTLPDNVPPIIEKLNDAVNNNITTNEILSLVEEVRCAVEINNGKGLVIIFDELGKFLEYEARHYDTNDIYILQALAEMAAIGRKTNVYIFTLMHQGFDQYARGVGKELRNEWSKVQGRFENIPFLESTEQVIRVMSKAFVNNLAATDKSIIAEKCTEMATVFDKEKALPGSLDCDSAATLFSLCYPLHPIVTLTLPILCQKMAQNERTLFSYLGSKEQHGLGESIPRLKNLGDWVMPWEIFDYFVLNQPAVLTDPTTHRRWAEVITALERLGDAPLNHVELLKTIGLLNIIGSQGGLKASKNILNLCTKSKKATTHCTNALINSAVLQFRKFSNEYRVWQGSDFDLDSAVYEELGQIGRFDLPSAINNRNSLLPIVARRHTIKTGALRYFNPKFIDLLSYQNEDNDGAEQRLFFCIVETVDELKAARKDVVSCLKDLDVIALCQNGGQLREAVGEVIALNRIEQNYPELQNDPVAHREFKDRLANALRFEEELLQGFFEQPEKAMWYWKNEEILVSNKRVLQEHLSRILDNIYHSSPRIYNELINREKPSAQAAGARNKLVMAMVHHVDKVDLGITKFPAEKGIYRAFLQATGLHQEISDGEWALVPPTKGDVYNLYPVWKKIDEFLESTVDKPRSFADLNDVLRAPPFGIKVGVLPLLYLSVFLCNQEELALYEDNIYTPYISDKHIERFMKRPDYFTVQRIRMYGIRASLFQQYIKVLYNDNADQKASLLAVAKPLAQFITKLPEYTKQTNRISDSSQKARKAFELAKSPVDLLFVRLPKACGYPAIAPEEVDGRKIEGFAGALVEVIRELRDAHDRMKTEFCNIMSVALLPDLQEETMDLNRLRQKSSSRYEDLIKYTADIKGLRPFIENLANENGDDELWFNRILLFLGGRASDKWLDVHRDGAVKKLEELSRRLIDLRVLQDHYAKTKNKFGDGFELIRLRTMRHGKDGHDEIVRIDNATKEYIDKNIKPFQELLVKFDSDDSRLALLTELVEEILLRKDTKKRTSVAAKVKKANNE